MIEQTYISQIKQICCDFLVENGGMLNGYTTYISGSTELNSSFTVELPESFNKTRKENEAVSLKLKSELLKYLVDNNLNCIINFIPIDTNYSTTTHIEFVYPAGKLF